VEQQDIGTPPDESERRVVAPHQGDLTGLRPEWSELEITVEVWEQPSGTRRPPVHRDHETVLALVGFGKIHVDRLPETRNAEERSQTEREPFAVPVGGSRAFSDQRMRVCAHPSADLVKAEVDLHEVLDEHVGSQHPTAGRRRTEHHGVDPCDQRPAYTEPVATTRVRVLLCDDHELVRRGLRSLLESDLTIEVIGEAGSADEAVSASSATAPDVVVMDVRMPGRSGIEACRDIRAHREQTRVLILTSFADDEALFSAIMAGASGYVLKQIRGNDLLEAIHRVAKGESLLDPSVTGRVLARIRGDVLAGSEDGGVEQLTPQERRIVGLVAEGMTNRQIGERVHLAEKTVKNYVSNILMKLDLSRRAEVAAFMARRSRGGDAQDWS
jgi:two-component system, NarL family, response regulator DevR